jgi:xylan 1,4-beta-xylosidase
MGIAAQLQEIDHGFALIGRYPELKGIPVVIGESDPEGCAACQGPQLSYRNGTMFSSYTAAVFARKPELAAKYGVNLEGALTWAFEFEDQPCFAGFRALASCGIDLPVMNVFRMMGKMDGDQLAVTSSGSIPLEQIVREGVHGSPDISAVASRKDQQIAVLVWHYHDDDVPGPAAEVNLVVRGFTGRDGPVRLVHYRIDENHSNAYAAWKRMGSPAAPSSQQYDELQTAGALSILEEGPKTVQVRGGKAELKFELPRQAVSLVVIKAMK